MTVHEPDTWAGHVDRIARVLGCILEHLEGEKHHREVLVAFAEQTDDRLDALETRLDAADKRRADARECRGREWLSLAVDALCGIDENEGEDSK